MKSHFDKILALDVETSGLNKNSIDPSEGYQIVSIGMVVVDVMNDFKSLDEIYIEIKWNGQSIWDDEAQRIHGFSKSYLEKNGISEEDAVEKIALFIFNHFGVEKPICLLGHNPQFDKCFLKSLLEKYELPFKFSHRSLDTFSLTLPTIGTFDSNEMFEFFGFPQRITHNSLKDIKMTLKVVQLIRKMWNDVYD